MIELKKITREVKVTAAVQVGDRIYHDPEMISKILGERMKRLQLARSQNVQAS